MESGKTAAQFARARTAGILCEKGKNRLDKSAGGWGRGQGVRGAGGGQGTAVRPKNSIMGRRPTDGNQFDHGPFYRLYLAD